MAVSFLAAGVDAGDVAAVLGVDGGGGKAPFPRVAGHGGVAVVTAVGGGVKGLKAGDYVVPAKAGLGTWRHAAVVGSADVLAVPKSVPLEAAATLTSGAATALRLLSDFGALAAGDTVVQSGGESAVGEAVVQLAAARGVKTVTFVKVRRRRLGGRLGWAKVALFAIGAVHSRVHCVTWLRCCVYCRACWLWL